VEGGAVLDRIQKLLASPELVARAWAAAKRNDEHEITEREVTVLLCDFATVWNELFPAEQARIVPTPGRAGRRAGESHRGADRGRGTGKLGRGTGARRKGGGMIQRAETRIDGTTLVVRIPMDSSAAAAGSGLLRPMAVKSCRPRNRGLMARW
jgi:hypothetical protein